MDHTTDYYATLGVTASADEVVIRAAYKALAQKYHPDKVSGPSADQNAVMSAINEAYSVLGDRTKRAQYDQLRSGAFQQPKHPPPKKPRHPSTPRPHRWTAPLDHIDGWSTERVQGLQKRFASALGKTVIFQDPPFTVKAVGGFLGFGSGAKIIQCPEMAVIPPGGLMGHLEVQQSFALGLYAVTNEEYVAFCRATGHKEPEDSRRAHHPVRHVSWFDAFDYCAWLSVGTGEEYRLPTQKEWEYACRAGTTTKYIFGDTITPKQANFGGMYYLQSKGIFPKDPNHKPRYPVGSYSGTNAETAVKRYFPNAWGLFQMHGNVSEWVADVYPGNKRLTCGGGWGAYEEDVGSDSFLELDATEAGLDIGFRVARSLKQAT